MPDETLQKALVGLRKAAIRRACEEHGFLGAGAVKEPQFGDLRPKFAFLRDKQPFMKRIRYRIQKLLG